jgi:hypothetical protein
MQRVVLALERLGPDGQALAHRRQQARDGFGRWGCVSSLDPADRRLVCARPQGQSSLAEAVPFAYFSNEFTSFHG